ncbi:hypothetical protein EST38_g12094 [Candolleomyces aberdarensis]|uniref:laccase n=1 Tax=Candolleomyces aberdarensis TaxID=2316362 RepID=A0A4Q2D3A0_9AGAR|nr:hypothetical protein EST38_g12094 [Candolleomyces aberdarensis]
MRPNLILPVLVGFLVSPLLTLGVTIGPTDPMTISNVQIAPDGSPRAAAVVNGIHPGPLIVAQKGDNFDVVVTNNLTDPSMTLDTSIHWHGIFQRGTTWADGPEGVSQCPIPPNGTSFRYQFSTSGQAGSFWYHSHFGNQYCDGVRGPIVIYDENDPHRDKYNEDNEDTVITVTDWSETCFLSTANFRFSIDGHKLVVIEADGESTMPTAPVDGVQIFAGQRYSLILNASQPISNYWIRANPDLAPLRDRFEGGVNSAILRYAGAPEVEPTTPLPPSLEFLRESDLYPFSNPNAPGLPQIDGNDFNKTFAVDFNGTRFLMNNVSWQAPSAPILLQILTGSNASELMPQASIVQLRRNMVVQLNISSVSTRGTPHPFHLHGHAFSVIKSADSNTFNFENPVRRDVVSIGGVGQFAVIRFVTDNPGPWIFHCHIEPHLSAGLAVVFVEDFENIIPSNPIPQSWRDLCVKF